MKKVLQKIIQWTTDNAFTVEGQDGTVYTVIDLEEMRAKFDEWLQRDKQQAIEYLTVAPIITNGLQIGEAERSGVLLICC